MSNLPSQSRHPAGAPTGGQFAASAKAESGVTLAEPTEDDLDFARETLGPDATEDEIRNLADLRLDRDAPGVPDPQFFPPAALTPRDVEHLVENRGRFVDGYDSDDINRVLGRFEGAHLVCVWDYFDDIGYGGSSDFAGFARNAEGRQTGSWRGVHPQVWEYLSDPDSDLDPESIPSLLSDEVFDGHDDVDGLSGDGFSNLAVESYV